MLEVTVLRGRNLVPKDSNGNFLTVIPCALMLTFSLSLSPSFRPGLSDPYIVVKYGSSVMFRTHVIEKCLNPEWNENVSLAAPSHDDIIKVVHTYLVIISIFFSSIFFLLAHAHVLILHFLRNVGTKIASLMTLWDLYSSPNKT